MSFRAQLGRSRSWGCCGGRGRAHGAAQQKKEQRRDGKVPQARLLVAASEKTVPVWARLFRVEHHAPMGGVAGPPRTAGSRCGGPAVDTAGFSGRFFQLTGGPGAFDTN